MGEKISDITSAEAAQVFNQFLDDVPNWDTGTVEKAIELADKIISLFTNTDQNFANIKDQLNAIIRAVGGEDYLALVRDMEGMRGNARAVQTSLKNFLRTNNPDTRAQLNTQVAKLESDIETLLIDGTSNGYFQKPYLESFIAGDGLWQHVMPYRPDVSPQGTCFEHRPGIPTIMALITVRVGYEAALNPNYVADLSLQDFIAGSEGWNSRLVALSDFMKLQVRSVPVTKIEVQCTKISSSGRNTLGSSDWQNPVNVPYGVSPMGAVDLSTGIGRIDWNYMQFNVYYLKDRLPFHTPNTQPAPCLGADYRPPPEVQPPTPALEVAAQYYEKFRSDSSNTATILATDLGADMVWEFAGHLMPLIGQIDPSTIQL